MFVMLLVAVASVAAVDGQWDYVIEKYRLQLHFSVPLGWLNDPNGLVYHHGIYHLFYQHHPYSNKWGPMHWGHAQSTDLIHWQNMPIALQPYDKGAIFSGCCVSDTQNVTGLGQSSPATATHPLIAIYTLDNSGNQSQAMAYSLDDGVTWTTYDSNPIVPNPGFVDFRDPNIIVRDGKFYMALAAGDRIMFYSSDDLKAWTRQQEFGLVPNQVIFSEFNIEIRLVF